MPLRDFKCEKCDNEIKDRLVKVSDMTIKCPECENEMNAILSTHKSYTINGNNSASVTPKRYRK